MHKQQINSTVLIQAPVKLCLVAKFVILDLEDKDGRAAEKIFFAILRNENVLFLEMRRQKCPAARQKSRF